MACARDPETHAYYDARAEEYDQWYEGEGRYRDRERPGWSDEVDAVVRLVDALPPARTLDVACGTGFLTRHLRGFVVGLDQSPAMVAVAQERLPDGLALVGDALRLPFADASFDRIVTGHFYGHLVPDERAAFLDEARRVARELIVIDTAPRPDPDAPRETWEERVLNDGSKHRVFKRFLTAAEILEELGEAGGTGEALMDGQWFAAVRATLWAAHVD
jgi:ubiquinone/menaquinone biosynthesis C-methylase UbiE